MNHHAECDAYDGRFDREPTFEERQYLRELSEPADDSMTSAREAGPERPPAPGRVSHPVIGGAA